MRYLQHAPANARRSTLSWLTWPTPSRYVCTQQIPPLFFIFFFYCSPPPLTSQIHSPIPHIWWVQSTARSAANGQPLLLRNAFSQQARS